MLHIGLTGNIASGKSAVATQLAALGATVIDADVLAREAVRPGTPGLAAIVGHFGHSILAADGSLDRAQLREIVFADPAEREALNAIVHPEVGRLRATRIADARQQGAQVVVSDIPLLFEVGLERRFDGIVLVDAPEAVRLDRLVRLRGLDRAQAQAMISTQQPSAEKRARSTWVIDNDGSPEQLAAQVAELWTTLVGMAGHVSHEPPHAP